MTYYSAFVFNSPCWELIFQPYFLTEFMDVLILAGNNQAEQPNTRAEGPYLSIPTHLHKLQECLPIALSAPIPNGIVSDLGVSSQQIKSSMSMLGREHLAVQLLMCGITYRSPLLKA